MLLKGDSVEQPQLPEYPLDSELKERLKPSEQPLAGLFEQVNSILKDYIDMSDSERHKIALWIIGASMKDAFTTFPILYINAPMASGKSRLLKLLKALIPKSVLTMNLTEAVLFRIPTAENLNALLIDEAEGITSKEKGNLKELLNACYKKGSEVIRMKKNQKTDQYETEHFEIFVPVAIANITGLEGVVESRSICIILERSNNQCMIKKPEMFEFDNRFKTVKSSLFSVGSECRFNVSNTYNSVSEALLMNLNIHYTYTTQSYTTYTDLLDGLEKTPIGGRDMEIWMPLLTIASKVSLEVLQETFHIAEEDALSRKESTAVEDRDTTFLLYLFTNYITDSNREDYHKISDIRSDFRELEGIGKSDYWPSGEWIGRCLKRLKVIKHKRRMAKGIEVLFDYEKIKSRIEKLGYVLADLKSVEDEEDEIQKKIRQQQLDDINREEEVD
jgi:hypothetical protein